MQKVLIIYNPSSGSKNSTNIAEELNTILQNIEIITSVYATTGDDNFKQLISDHMAKGFDSVASLGGDGTVSKIVNAIATFENRPKILLLPTGTMNNLARSLGLNLNIDKYLLGIEQGHFETKEIDVGKINDDYFISTVSVGSIPEMAWKTNEEHKENFGPLGYILDSFQVLNEEKTFDIQIKADGQEESFEDVTLMIISISNSVFGVQTFFEGTEIDDGYLHVYILKQGGLLTKMSTLTKDVLQNRQSNTVDHSYRGKFKEAIIDSNMTLNFALDGEKGPRMPARLEVLEKHLTFYIIK